MKLLKEHRIEDYGSPYLLDWIKHGEYRNKPFFDEEQQIKTLKEIAKIPDDKARKLLMELLEVAEELQKNCVEMHTEMKTIHNSLVTISKCIDEQEKK
jgi:hypothetical protein